MHARFLLAGIALTGALVAQQVIVPSAVATTRPTSSSQWSGNVFYSTTSTTIAHDSRAQLIYDVNDIAPTTATWNSLSVRRPTGLGNTCPSMTTNAMIQMSVSPLAYAAVTTTFANNHSATPTLVLNGPVSLPQATNPGTWPAPWEAPFPFAQPFSYFAAAGSSLVVDIHQTGNSATATWYVEAWLPDTGARANNGNAQSTCRFSNGNYNSGLGYNLPRLGANWYVNYSSVLPNSFGFAVIGTQGQGGLWGGIPLPIDLTLFGAPGCVWSASDDIISVPLTSNASGSAGWPTTLVAIPNHRSFIGFTFHDHAAIVDVAANAFGLVTTWSSKWTVGSNRGQPGAMVYAVGNSAANPTGTRAVETTVSLQLN